MSYTGRRVTIVGLGREGVDLAQFLSREQARITVTDQKPAEQLQPALQGLNGLEIRYLLGGHPVEEALEADVLFASPGVAPDSPLLVEARRRGVPVSSATRLLMQRSPGHIVGVTGSSGKTTTTTLVGQILQLAGLHCLVGGNIGVPLLRRLDEIGPESWLVLELSSFQLETVDRSPHVAAVTNVTPNHLDRHPSLEAYAAAKAQIFSFQTPGDWAVLNADDAGSGQYCPKSQVLRFSLQTECRGAYLAGHTLTVDVQSRPERVCARHELRLRGLHNVANALAACAIASAADAPVEAMRSVLLEFEGVPHRLETVEQIAGVVLVNDSIATTPERSIAALLSFDHPIVLIAGGRDKHLPMEDWARVIAARCRHVVTLGEMAGPVEAAIGQVGEKPTPVTRAESMQEAVRVAFEASRPGDVVLLSPGGTSFDRYEDFEARGRHFAECARALRAEALA